MPPSELSNDPQEPTWLREINRRTPARVFADRSGWSYRTSTWLQLRQDHAAATDAVHAELEIDRDLGAEFVARHGLFTVSSRARNKREFLLHPELGRQLSDVARQDLASRCRTGCDFQIVLGDGLSVAAVNKQVPQLLPRMQALATQRGWQQGQPFAVRYCRVGILNDVGNLLAPRVAVLLIGERPGLATAESLSAYMAYQPRAGHTDAQRNLISNIHARGVPIESAAERIVQLAEKMLAGRASGVLIKEDTSNLLPRVGQS